MTETITVRITKQGDDVLLSSEALALLFGEPLDRIRQLTTDSAASGSVCVTEKMVRNGKRRIREAFAAIGDDDMWAAMEYWAARDHNATVNFVVDQGAHS